MEDAVSFFDLFWLALLYGSTLWLPMVAADNGGGVAKFLKLPGCNVPLWTRKLGPNKTIWAYPMGIFLAVGTIKLERLLFESANNREWTYGLVIGFGAVLGDHVKSYFKRRKGIAPGAQWFPWDQIDFAIGGSTAYAVLAYYTLGPSLWYEIIIPTAVILIALITKPIGNYLFYLVGLRATPH